MNVEYFIANRLFTAKKENNRYTKPILGIAILAIAFSVAIMLLSVMIVTGFKKDISDKIIGFNSHIVIQSQNEADERSLLESNYIKSISKNIIFSNTGEVVLISNNFTKGLSLRGYKKKDFRKLEIYKKVNYENKKDFFEGKTISIGKELSFDLNLDIGDTVLLMSPTGEDTIIGNLPKQENYKKYCVKA